MKKLLSFGFALVIGLLVYYTVSLIPVIGWIVSLLVAAVGTGVLLLEKKRLYSSLRTKKIV